MGEHCEKFVLAPISLDQLRIGLDQQLFLTMQLQEDPDLAREYAGIQRLDQKVHRARFVALEHAIPIVQPGGDEDDGDLAGALHVAHQLGQGKAIQLGHLYVN